MQRPYLTARTLVGLLTDTFMRLWNTTATHLNLFLLSPQKSWSFATKMRAAYSNWDAEGSATSLSGTLSFSSLRSFGRMDGILLMWCYFAFFWCLRHMICVLCCITSPNLKYCRNAVTLLHLLYLYLLSSPICTLWFLWFVRALLWFYFIFYLFKFLNI